MNLEDLKAINGIPAGVLVDSGIRQLQRKLPDVMVKRDIAVKRGITQILPVSEQGASLGRLILLDDQDGIFLLLTKDAKAEGDEVPLHHITSPCMMGSGGKMEGYFIPFDCSMELEASVNIFLKEYIFTKERRREEKKKRNEEVK